MARHEVVFNTNIYSPNYIQINCCGWMETVNGGGLTKRPFGRADYQILYIFKGSMLMDGVEQKAGTVILYKPTERQIYFATSAETTYYWIHFSGYLADEFFKNAPSRVIRTNHQPAIIKFIQDTVTAINSPTPPTDRYVEAELLCLLNKIAGKSAQNNTVFHAINPAIIHMNENYTDNLSNEDYAQMCGMSKFHFIRKFSELVDMPPQKYRMKIVLEKSLEFLSESDDKISIIAEELGFSDHMYFSKLFKRHFNVTPSEYRRAIRSNAHIRDNKALKEIFSVTNIDFENNFSSDVKVSLSDKELKICSYIEVNPKASTLQIATALNMTHRTLQRVIKNLKSKGIIYNRGNRKNINWKLKVDNIEAGNHPKERDL